MTTPRLVCLAGLSFLLPASLQSADSPLPFEHELIAANAPFQSHCKGVGDFDGDGQLDVVIGSGWDGDGLYWYRYPNWTQYTIVPPGVTGYSTDMQVADVDNDGDPDLVIPKGYFHGSSSWWYENPRPGGDPRTDPWPEHFIGNGAAHDVVVGDIDKDGRIDVVTRYTDTWLHLQTGPDTWTRVFLEDGTQGGEGTALGDLDGDGDLDVVLNGHWLENPLPSGNPTTASSWTTRVFDSSWPVDGKVYVADLDSDGRNDIILGRSENAGNPLVWYESASPRTGPWTKRVIDPTADHNHSIGVGDMDLDGDLDVIVAEMLQSSDPDQVRIFYNVGGSATSWVEQVVSTKGSHNIRIADFDADGDLDIFGANWDGSTGIDLWRNRLDSGSSPSSLDDWDTHLIDGALAYKAVTVDAGDLDGDGDLDVATGGWWYRNPGTIGGSWAKTTVGSGIENVGIIHDFDGDGDPDILGANGTPTGGALSFARNNGSGSFSIFGTPPDGPNSFLQGFLAEHLTPGGPLQVALSWHGAETSTVGVQILTVPGDPASQAWPRIAVQEGEEEALSPGDIDGDGDLDIFQGSLWLRNDGSGNWTQFQATTYSSALGYPDRNVLRDIDGDGDLDAVVGFEPVTPGDPTDLIWLEAPADPTGTWTQHVIASGVGGGFALDAADMDHDGDIDVVLGEHQGATRLLVYENTGGGGGWTEHLVHPGGSGIDHHLGARLWDIDGDGDLDIVSIGWNNEKLWIFENLAQTGGGGGPDVTPPSTPTGLSANAVSSSAIALSWTGSSDDSGAIASYRVFRGGSFVGSTASTSFTDTGLVPETTYSYRVSALDPSGNESGLSSPASATTLPSSSGGGPELYAGWAFEESSGATTVDASGNGFDGTIVSPGSRTDLGRFGRAVEFQGNGGRVDLGGLDIPGSELTISCWFNASSFAINDGRLISKATGVQANDHWWMLSTIASGGGIKPRFRLKTSSGSTTTLIGNSLLSTGVWTHVAGTYDGSAMRLYVDGNLVGTATKSGTIATDSSVFASIGDNPTGGRSFDGRIDEVRIHTTALSQAQIQALLDVPIGDSGSGDTTPPSAPTNVAATAVSSSEISVSWSASTDDSGTVASYNVSRDGSVVANITATSYSDTGLAAGTTYTYSVTALDPSGNESTASSSASATTSSGADTTPPSVPANVAATALSSSAINVSWSASSDDSGTVASYHVIRDGSVVANVTGTSYSDTGLAAGTSYAYTVTALDPSGNESAASSPANATTFSGSGGATLVSDDFDGCELDPAIWTVVDPVGDGSASLGASGNDAVLELSVPAGTGHDLWTSGNFALRALQSTDDVDFEVSAKFLSTVSERFQIQGIIVEAANGDFLRFERYSNGSSTLLFAAAVIGASGTTHYNTTVPSISPSYLRVARSGDEWTFSHSSDGASWTEAVTFTQGMTVSAVGLDVGDAGTNPGHTSLVDWFEVTGDPISNEDSGSGGSRTVTTFVSGPGSITQTPAGTDIPCGTTVTFEAVPDAGASFDGWSGDINTTQNPIDVLVTDDLAITANFSGGSADTTPPSTPLGLAASAVSTSAINVSWNASTDDSGTIASYRVFRGGSFVASVTSTSYTDSGLAADTTYTYRVSAVDPSGNESGLSAPASATTLASSGGGGGGPLSSDDFDGCALDSTTWTIVDPVGDGSVELEAAGAGDAVLALSVPAGTDHDLWTAGNRSLQVVQPLDDTDFEVTVKFLSTVSERYQIQGLHVEDPQGNFVRFDVNADSSSSYLFGAVIENGTYSIELNSNVASASPSYLRMSRSGNQWTFSYSTDGSTFSDVASFAHAMEVVSVGIHAGNAGGDPAHTALVDWFEVTGDPIANEDSGGGGSRTVTTFVSGPGSITQTPSGTDIPCGTTVTFEAVPDSGASFVGWSGDVNSTQNPIDVLVTDDLAITATFSGGSSDTTPPSAPTGLTATATSPSAIDVSWNASTDDSGTIASYRIFRGGTLIGTAGGTSYTDTGLASDTTYTYTVSALDPSGNESALSAPASATTLSTADTTPPSVPTGLSASPASPSAIDLFWNASTDDSGTVASYRVFLDGGFVANVTGTGYTDNGLASDTTYTYTVSAVDPSGNESGLSSPASASTFAGTGAGLLSDDFDGCSLDTSLWTIVDPVGDGSVALANTGSDAVLELSVPAGTDHDLWTPGNKSVRVTQPLDDEDFEVTVKFLSTLSKQYQIQGLDVEDPQGNFVRFDLNADNGGTFLFGAVIENGTYTNHLAMDVPSASPTFLRMARSGNDWTFSYSTDGSSYSDVASFSKVFTATSVGIHAGNAGGDPAHTAVVDWFLVDGDSMANEDSGSGASRSVSTFVSGPGSIAQTPTGTEFPCGTTVTFEAIPDSGASFVGWSGGVSSTANPIDVVINDDLAITATFSSGDGGGQSDTTPPSTPAGVAASPASTSAIDVSWNASTDDSGAAPSYRVFRDGVLAGTATSTAFTDTGLTADTTYTYTVRALDASGNESAPSAPASATTFAPDTDPPTTPDGVAATAVSSSMIEVTWNDSSDASGIDHYDIFRDGSLAGSSTTPSFIDSGLEPDTLYEYRVSAIDPLGNESPQSVPASAMTPSSSSTLAITLWYGSTQSFGTHGISTPFANILGNVSPSPGASLVSLEYSIDGGPPTNLSIGPDTRRLAEPGDFNADIPVSALSQGANNVEIFAEDSNGNAVVASITVNFDDSNTWPLPYTADWSTATAIQELADVVDGHWAIQSGTVRPLQLAYDRLIAIGDRTWTDYEVSTPITIHGIDPGGFDPPSNDPGIGYILRWPGHNDQSGEQPDRGFLPLGALGWYRFKENGNNLLQILGNDLGQTNRLRQLDLGTTYVFKMRVETIPGTGGLYSLKVWPASQTEPASWDVERQESLSDPQEGCLLLIAHHVDASFGTVTVTPAD